MDSVLKPGGRSEGVGGGRVAPSGTGVILGATAVVGAVVPPAPAPPPAPAGAAGAAAVPLAGMGSVVEGAAMSGASMMSVSGVFRFMPDRKRRKINGGPRKQGSAAELEGEDSCWL